MKQLNFLFFVTIVLIAIWGCAPKTSTIIDKQQASVKIDSTAQLYVFNISGPTLIPQNQKVIDNGDVLVSLPRNKYTSIKFSTGQHELTFPYRKKPVVNLNVIEGEKYYVVVGYKPTRSWAFPLAGDPLVIRQISEREAQPLIEKLDHQQVPEQAN